MTKIDILKREMDTMHDLENLTSMLEQTAARTIAQMRSNITDSRTFFREVWKIHAVLKQLMPPPPEVIHKHLIVAIGIDWGMPGNLLNRVMSKVQELQQLNGADLLIAGKMSHSRFRDKDDCTVHFFPSPKNPTLADIQPIYKVVAGYAHVTIVYPMFESLSRQDIRTASFSVGAKDPALTVPESETEGVTADEKVMIDAKRFIIDPSPQDMANYLGEAIVGLTMHHYFAESVLAYSAAQMVAMRNSHDNAKQEGKHLFIRYNRARREVIDAKLREVHGSRSAHKKAADDDSAEESSL